MKLHLSNVTAPWRKIALQAVPAVSTSSAAPANPLSLAPQTITDFGG